MADTKASAFISYGRSDDEPFVEQLHHDLEARGIHVWWDRQSMSNRGLTFLDEIQRAIESVDRVIAVVGPAAIRSDYVRYEWDYAVLFGKVVVPILRLGDYTSIPGDLLRDFRNDHCPDFRAERPYDQALSELERILSEPPALFGPIGATPALPLGFLPRSGLLNAMRQCLYADLSRPKATASATEQTLVLHGMSGSGKSVIAAAFARTMETRRAANHGVVWLKVGRDTKEPDTKPADRLANLRLVGSVFDDDPKRYSDENQARARLSQLLEDKGCLIVLDDVWSKEDAEPYLNALGPRCRLLITTRDASLGAVGQSKRVEMLEPAEALELLARSSRQRAVELPPAAGEVAAECGNLPLALALIGSMVAGNPSRWDYVLHRLRTFRLDKIQFPIPNYEHPDLFRAIHISVDDLKSAQQARYLELAVFPPGVPLPERAIQVLWEQAGVDPYDAADLVDLYVRRSLARRIDAGRIALHDLQADYVRAASGDLAPLHRRLLAGYSKRCSEGWPSGPDDGYFFQFLPYHLVDAGQNADLRELLLTYAWLNSKLRAANVIQLISDYDYLAGDTETRLVQQTLQLAAPCLADDKGQLRVQIYARLLPFQNTGLAALAAAARDATGTWMRPLAATLTLPGGPLLRTLTGHEGFVNTVALFDQGRRAISGSDDRTARIWDLERGVEIMKLAGHSNVVTAVAVTSDGTRAVTAPWDYTLKVWDLKEGKEIRPIAGPKAKTHALVIEPNNRFVISASSESIVRLWDLDSGTLAGTLEGHTRDVTALAITPDGHTLVSGSWDGKIGLWDLNERKLLRFVPAHDKWIIGLIADNENVATASTDRSAKVFSLPDGKQIMELTGVPFYGYAAHPITYSANPPRIILGGGGGEIIIWDFEKGQPFLFEQGHTAWITAVEAFPDNQRVITASGDKTIKMWDLTAQRPEQRPAHAYFASHVTITPDGKQAISGSPRDGLKSWDLSTLDLLRSIAVPARDRVARMLMLARYGMSMQEGDFLAAAIFPDCQLCAWALQDETVRVTRVDDAQELARLSRPHVEALAVTPDGRYVVCGISARDLDASGEIAVWEWQANRVVSSTPANSPSVLTISPDGRTLLSGSLDRDGVGIYSLPDGKALPALSSQTPSVGAMAFSPDGRRIFFAGRDNIIRAANIQSGEVPLNFSPQRDQVYGLAVSADGCRLASASEDCSLRVWDTASGQKLASFMGDVPFHSVAMAPDGLIVAGDHLGRVHFLRMEPESFS